MFWRIEGSGGLNVLEIECSGGLKVLEAGGLNVLAN